MTELRLERTFAARRADVFAAWTEPEVLRRWWASQPGWRGADAVVDLRVGGRYRLAMADPESGAVHAVGGEYLEVAPPERLVYTWTWEGDPPEMRGSAGSLVTVDFLERDDATAVVLTHSGLADEHVRDLHVGGWSGCLDNLEMRALA
jgi:uncharacterized protein YndB with AHSA1/START domain